MTYGIADVSSTTGDSQKKVQRPFPLVAQYVVVYETRGDSMFMCVYKIVWKRETRCDSDMC